MRISDWSSDVCSSDLLQPYLLKGVKVAISGEFETSEYEGKTQLNIRANEVDIMSSRKDQNESGGHRNRDGMGGNSLPPQEELDDSVRSEEHTSELQSLMRISYAVFCLKKNNNYKEQATTPYSV